MRNKDCAIAAGQMFVIFFDKDQGDQFDTRLQETKELVEATLALRSLPDNSSKATFTHALCELECFSVADKRVVLETFRGYIDHAMGGEVVVSA